MRSYVETWNNVDEVNAMWSVSKRMHRGNVVHALSVIGACNGDTTTCSRSYSCASQHQEVSNRFVLANGVRDSLHQVAGTSRLVQHSTEDDAFGLIDLSCIAGVHDVRPGAYALAARTNAAHTCIRQLSRIVYSCNDAQLALLSINRLLTVGCRDHTVYSSSPDG